MNILRFLRDSHIPIILVLAGIVSLTLPFLPLTARKIKASGRRLFLFIGVGVLLIVVGISPYLLPTTGNRSSANNAPTILGVTIRTNHDAGELVYSQEVNFFDEDGNTVRIERELLDLSDPSQRPYIQIQNGPVDAPPEVQRIRATASDVWHCQGHVYMATIAVSLVDADGNRSAPVRYTIDCK